jgi:hypothetical protein
MAVWFLLVCKMRCGTADRLRHYPVASASGSQPPLWPQRAREALVEVVPGPFRCLIAMLTKLFGQLAPLLGKT